MPVVDVAPGDGHEVSAIVAHADLLRHDIGSGPLWVQLGHLLKDAGFLGDAEAAYRSAMQCDATEWDPKLHLAHLLKRCNRLHDALALFEAIRDLPDAPNVDLEIAGMRVALRPENARIARPEAPASGTPRAPQLIGVLRDLDEAFGRFVEDIDASSTPHPGLKRTMRSAMASRELAATLEPKANLVIRDGLFVGTTGNPQFRIQCADPCSPGWVEIDFGIEMDEPLIEPVLYVQHASRWQAFSTFGLAPKDGRFHAVCLLDQPVISLRLDPSNAAGAFTVTHFSLKQIDLMRIVRYAWDRDRAATREVLLRRRGKRFPTREKGLADILANPPLDAYQRWIRKYETRSDAVTDARRAAVADSPRAPSFAVVLTWNREAPGLSRDTIASLRAQTYPHWTLDVLATEATLPARRREVSALIEGATFHTDPAAMLRSRDGGYVVTLRAGDRLAATALLRLAEEIAAAQDDTLDGLYSDEDHILDGIRCQPLFKPDWDPDFQAHTQYIGSFVAVRRELLEAELGRFHDDIPAIDRLVSAVLSRTGGKGVVHIPEILHHRHRLRDVSTVPPFTGPEPASGWPHVTLMIPTRDSVDILRDGISSLLQTTDYPSFDILIIDNGSTEAETLRYFTEIKAGGQVSTLAVPGPFNFSKLNNLAVQAAKGTIVGLVNNDILAIEPHWLKAMVQEAVRPEIGAVGAKLVYPSGHVQHAGMACGVGFVTAHPQKFRDGDDRGYMDTLVFPRRVSAVTGACLIVETRKYREVGGLDEMALPVSFNDVDLCLKLHAAGYRNLFTPFARLIHLESATRGLDVTGEKAERFRREADVVLDRWTSRIRSDPYYSVNLTPLREDCSIRD